MPDDQRTQEIEKRIDREITGGLAIAPHGGNSLVVAPQNMTEVLEMAKLMAVSGICVRPMFRGNPGACLAIILQAMKWGADPFAVANQAFEVNGQLSYQSQLIHAIVNSSPALSKRLQVSFMGEGQTRKCIVVGSIRGEDEPREYESPMLGQITPKNSPLWKSDPDQQLFYYSARAWARRWVPEILLGIYVPEELSTIELVPAEPQRELSKLERFEERHSPPAANPEPTPSYAVVDLEGVEPIPASPPPAAEHPAPEDITPAPVAPAQGDPTPASAEVPEHPAEAMQFRTRSLVSGTGPRDDLSPSQDSPAERFPAGSRSMVDRTPAGSDLLDTAAPKEGPPLELLEAGERAAKAGSERLELWWKSGLSALQRASLGARGRGVGRYLPAWKKLAEEADARREAKGEADAVSVPANDPRGEDQEIPFPDAAVPAASDPIPDAPVGTTAPASTTERPNRHIDMVTFGGRKEPRLWWTALFLPKLSQVNDGGELSDLVGHNAAELDEARAAVGKELVDDALHERWRAFDASDGREP